MLWPTNYFSSIWVGPALKTWVSAVTVHVVTLVSRTPKSMGLPRPCPYSGLKNFNLASWISLPESGLVWCALSAVVCGCAWMEQFSSGDFHRSPATSIQLEEKRRWVSTEFSVMWCESWVLVSCRRIHRAKLTEDAVLIGLFFRDYCLYLHRKSRVGGMRKCCCSIKAAMVLQG